MDPHAPYLPPAPYERMFYHGNESDPNNRSMDPVMSFKPFCDFFASWMPPRISDKDYVIAQYDGGSKERQKQELEKSIRFLREEIGLGTK